MSKFVAFVAVPGKGTCGDNTYRTGKLRVAEIPKNGEKIRTYSIRDLSSYEARTFLEQLGFGEEAKDLPRKDLHEMLEEVFAPANKHSSLEEAAMNLVEDEWTPAPAKILYVSPEENLRSALRSAETKDW